MKPQKEYDMLAVASEHLERGEYDKAISVCNAILNIDGDNPVALFIIGHALILAERYGLAYTIFKRVCELSPNKNQAWNNLGRCLQELKREPESASAFKCALKIKPTDAASLSNLGLTYVNMGKQALAIPLLEKALQINPDMREAKDNIGLAYLALGEWAKGWDGYSHSVGNKHRKMRPSDLPTWDGEHGKDVLFVGEQGLGDEIIFASCLPDAIAVCKNVYVECDARLVRLFERSFPTAKIYGTRYQQKEPQWMADKSIDARMILGDLPRLFRRSAEAFPGTPYLTPDPAKRRTWREKLDALGDKPKVGVAWRGGTFSTNAERRSLDHALDLVGGVHGCDFISLEYRKHDEACLHQFDLDPDDYDDTAALVAELDLVISVTTAIVHLAGAVGVPCYCMVPDRPRWFYGVSGDSLPWYKSLKMFRKRSGQWPIKEVAHEANTNIHRLRQERDRGLPRAESLNSQSGECASDDNRAEQGATKRCA